jgi:hypothetical protein
VKPETVRLKLADGERWVEIKTRLTIRDQRIAQMSAIRTAESGSGGFRKFELEALYDLRKVETYLVDWNFVNENEKAVEVSRDAIEALDVETFEEIKELIEAHEERMGQEKKALGGSESESKPKAISA